MRIKLSSFTQRFFRLPRAMRVAGYCLLGYLLYAALLGLLTPYLLKTQAPAKLSELLGRPVSIAEIKINPFLLDAEIRRFRVDAVDHADFAAIDRLSVEVNFWRSVFQQTLDLERLQIAGLSANLARLSDAPQASFNFSDLLTRFQSEAPPATPAAETAALMPVKIADFELTGATLRLEDKVTGGILSYPEINLQLTQFDSRGLLARAEADARAINSYALQIDDQDEARIGLQGQFQLQPLRVMGELQLERLQLTRFWPFVAAEFAARLDSGQLGLKSHYQLSQDKDQQLQLQSDQGHLSLERLEFSHREQTLLVLPEFVLDDIAVDLAAQRVTIADSRTRGLMLKAAIDKDGVDLLPLFMPKFLALSQQESPKAAQVKPEPQAEAQTATEMASDAATGNITAKAAAEANWLVTLGGFTLQDYDINLSEQGLAQTQVQWRIYPLNLSTGEIRSDLSQAVDYELSLELNQQGKLQAQGRADLLQQTLDTKIALTQLALAQFEPYISPFLSIDIDSGSLSTQGELRADAAGKAIYKGSARVDELLIRDKQLKAPLLQWQSLAVEQLAFDAGARQLTIDTLAFAEPYAKVIIAEDRSTNIGNLVVAQAAQPSAAEAATPVTAQAESGETSTKDATAAEDFNVTIDQISFANGSAFFADNSISPNFAASIESLEGQISALSSTPGTKASVDIRGKIDKYAPVTLKGDINPLLEQPFLDLDLDFKNVELTSVNPYSGTYAGYYIDKGQLSLALNYQLENNQLKGKNHLVIDQLELGKPSDSDLATSLPVTLAVALLQDRNGVIDLGMEVSGDLDSPDFSIGGIVLTAFTNVITKAVTAPFSLLAGLFGSEEALDKIHFAAGMATLEASEGEKLAILAKALADRPKLTVSIMAGVDAKNDSQALAEAQMKRQLAEIAAIEVEALPAKLSASHFPIQGPLSVALQQLYLRLLEAEPADIKAKILAEAGEQELTEETLLTRWHLALYNLCRNAIKLGEDDLGDLAQARSKAVKAYLVDTQGVAPERVFLLESRINLSQNAQEAQLTLGAE
ncbi:DUF748 domain-containing protein [Shewanella salipaludis]|uniref:DUF748 domain-containing protein n=1 Tax=Shewanella salipaludis TaxID=2723052 RepID=A0A972FW23_9GAMM|nr:DUF748 domain-containing protein [Shewanella salipaludis]NMH64318.1 DUF748 domain-containing protein [Shewanella salipaludis]